MKFALGQKVATTVACMGNEQPPVDSKGHRQCGSHADHFGMAGSFLENPCVSLQERPLELFHDVLFFRYFQMEKSLERVQKESLDVDDAQGAGHFPGLMPSHAVRNDKQMPPVATVLGLRLRHTRLVDRHGSCQLNDDEMILVARSDSPKIGQTEAPHREGTVGLRQYK